MTSRRERRARSGLGWGGVAGAPVGPPGAAAWVLRGRCPPRSGRRPTWAPRWPRGRWAGACSAPRRRRPRGRPTRSRARTPRGRRRGRARAGAPRSGLRASTRPSAREGRVCSPLCAAALCLLRRARGGAGREARGGGGGQRGGAFRRRRDGADSSDARARTRAPGSARESAPVLPSRFCSRLSPARFSRPFDLPSRARGLGASCDGRGGGGRVSGARRDGGEDRSPSRASTRDSRDVATRPSALVERSSHLLFLFSTLDDDLELLHCEIGASEGSRRGVRGRRAARRGPGCDRVFFFSPANRFPEKALGEDRETERRGRARDGARTVHQRVRRGVHVPAVLFQHRHHVLLRLARDRRQRFHLVSPLHRSRHKKMTPSTASSGNARARP